jgi:hypothetical protein
VSLEKVGEENETYRNLLPVTLNVVNLCRNAQVTLRSDFVCDSSDLGSESGELCRRRSVPGQKEWRGDIRTRSIIELMVSTSCSTSPFASIMTFCDKSPLATAVCAYE